MKKTKILFISYYFQPDNVIGALRATKLVKFLTRDFNCVCDVITVENETKKLKERVTIKRSKTGYKSHGNFTRFETVEISRLIKDPQLTAGSFIPSPR